MKTSQRNEKSFRILLLPHRFVLLHKVERLGHDANEIIHDEGMEENVAAAVRLGNICVHL